MKPLEKILNGADWKVLLPFYGVRQWGKDIDDGRLDPRNDTMRVALIGFYNMIPYVIATSSAIVHGMLKASELYNK